MQELQTHAFKLQTCWDCQIHWLRQVQKDQGMDLLVSLMCKAAMPNPTQDLQCAPEPRTSWLVRSLWNKLTLGRASAAWRLYHLRSSRV